MYRSPRDPSIPRIEVVKGMNRIYHRAWSVELGPESGPRRLTHSPAVCDKDLIIVLEQGDLGLRYVAIMGR